MGDSRDMFKLYSEKNVGNYTEEVIGGIDITDAGEKVWDLT